MQIGKNFTLNEFTRSDKAIELGIDNTKPPQLVIDNLKLLVSEILQPLRNHLKRAININSGYRCLELNKAVNGSATSQHVIGQASDIRVDGMKPYDVAKAIIELNLEFDQLILYDTFCHVSYSDRKRRQLLYNKSYTGKRL